MNKYESIVVFKTQLEEESRLELLEKFKSIIENEGKIENVEDWGVKRLAYEIQKLKEGYFYFITFEASTNLPKELERNYRISEDVIRYNIIRR